MRDGVHLRAGKAGTGEEFGGVVPFDVREVFGVDDPLGAEFGEHVVELMLVNIPDGVTQIVRGSSR